MLDFRPKPAPRVLSGRLPAMPDRAPSLWPRLGSDRPGFSLGTALSLTSMLLVYFGGLHASLSLGPGGDFPKFRDLLLYALSHDDLPSLSISLLLLLLLGPRQERRWGTVAFLGLSALSAAALPPLYALALFVGGAEASRICGYSATQLALFTAQCRQAARGRLLGCVPVWFLPWLLLVLSLLLLPASPALLHFCAICLGHNYRQSFIGFLQELEHARMLNFIPKWAYVLTSARLKLPTHTPSKRSTSPSRPTNEAARFHGLPTRDPSLDSERPWVEPSPSWPTHGSAALSEVQLLDEQMLKAGIMASLQDAPEDPAAKVEVPKSSVSSLRLQQLERMGFPTEKAVLALAASKQLDGAISLLIDDRVGEESVVVKGKSPLPSHST